MKRTLAIALAWAAATCIAAGPSERFQVSADGQEVLDTQTKLVWKRCPEGMAFDGTVCKGSAMKFSLAVAKQKAAAGWRVPTKDELSTLVIKTNRKPLVDATAFPGTPSSVFWALRPGFDDNLNASLVDFGNGRVYGSAGSKHLLRLVRDQ